jgi:hypothetical protein
MKLARFLGMIALACSVMILAGCDWAVSVKKQPGKSVEGEITIKGSTSLMRSASLATISATDLFIDTAGTDFALASSGMAALTVTNGSGSIIASKSFAWAKSGTKLVFQNPAAVQSWLNQYPSAAGVDAHLTYGNTPADGVDHVMTTAVVYQGTTQAAQTRTFPAECVTRYHTRQLCTRQ